MSTANVCMQVLMTTKNQGSKVYKGKAGILVCNNSNMRYPHPCICFVGLHFLIALYRKGYIWTPSHLNHICIYDTNAMMLLQCHIHTCSCPTIALLLPNYAITKLIRPQPGFLPYLYICECFQYLKLCIRRYCCSY